MSLEMTAFTVLEDKRTIRRLLFHHKIIPTLPVQLTGLSAELADEIWNDPLNASLRAVPNRVWIDEAGSKTPLLDPDETVYLPIPEPASGELRWYDTSKDKSLQEVAEHINALLVPTPFKPWPRPLDQETLYNFPLNVKLRKGTLPPRVCYLAVGKGIQDVPVSAGNQHNLKAQPEWFYKVWSYLDRLKVANDALEAQINAILDIKQHGVILYSAAVGMQGFLKIVKSYTRSRVDGLMAAAQAYADAIEADVVRDPKLTGIPHLNKLLTDVDNLVHDADIQPHLDKLNANPKLYPFTVIALTRLTQKGIELLAFSEKFNAIVDDLDRIIAGEKTGTTLGKIFDISSKFMGSIGSALGVTVGNTPGPMSLAVCVARASMLTHLPWGRRANNLTLEKYAKFLGRHFNFSADQIDELIKGARDTKSMLSPTATRVKVAELKASNTQSSGIWAGGIGILNLLGLACAIWQFKGDINDKKSAATLAGDVAGILNSTVATGAAVVQFLANIEKYKAAMSGIGAGFSWALSIAGLIQGAILIWQGTTESDPLKVWNGVGTMMASAGCILDMVITRWGSTIAIRAATAIGVEVIGVEAGVLAVGSAIATAVTVIGIAIVLGTIIVANWPAIKEAMMVSGPEKFCRATVEGIESDKHSADFPGSVKAKLAALKSAREAASLDDFNRGDKNKVVADLKKLGLRDAEMKIIFDRAIMSDYGEAYSSPYGMMY